MTLGGAGIGPSAMGAPGTGLAEIPAAPGRAEAALLGSAGGGLDSGPEVEVGGAIAARGPPCAAAAAFLAMLARNAGDGRAIVFAPSASGGFDDGFCFAGSGGGAGGAAFAAAA